MCMHNHTCTYKGNREHKNRRPELFVMCLLCHIKRCQHQRRKHQTKGSYNLSIFGDELGQYEMERIHLKREPCGPTAHQDHHNGDGGG